MSMLKLFFINALSARRLDHDRADAFDPLRHPDLDMMTMTELADLPLMPEHLGRDVSEIDVVATVDRRCA
jgi:hypothetical protein